MWFRLGVSYRVVMCAIVYIVVFIGIWQMLSLLGIVVICGCLLLCPTGAAQITLCCVHCYFLDL